MWPPLCGDVMGEPRDQSRGLCRKKETPQETLMRSLRSFCGFCFCIPLLLLLLLLLLPSLSLWR